MMSEMLLEGLGELVYCKLLVMLKFSFFCGF
jgi:hypothetical protein